MAGKKFLRPVGGIVTQIEGTDTSVGAANAGDIVALDATGKIDNSMLPTSSITAGIIEAQVMGLIMGVTL